jgi:hypothetical protein
MCVIIEVFELPVARWESERLTTKIELALLE